MSGLAATYGRNSAVQKLWFLKVLGFVGIKPPLYSARGSNSNFQQLKLSAGFAGFEGFDFEGFDLQAGPAG